jgi:hypothetical protein
MYESACCQVGVFLSFVFLLATSLRGRGQRDCLEERIRALPLSAFLSFVLSELVMLFRHRSCIRRKLRHEPMLIGCRIHPETG